MVTELVNIHLLSLVSTPFGSHLVSTVEAADAPGSRPEQHGNNLVLQHRCTLCTVLCRSASKPDPDPRGKLNAKRLRKTASGLIVPVLKYLGTVHNCPNLSLHVHW
jgi:hypothetical protein